jgi:hypothetical protein
MLLNSTEGKVRTSLKFKCIFWAKGALNFETINSSQTCIMTMGKSVRISVQLVIKGTNASK